MNRYYELVDQAHAKWMQAQDLVSRAEDCIDHNYPTDADIVAWYETLAKARELQEAAMALEMEAAGARIDMLKAQTNFVSIGG